MVIIKPYSTATGPEAAKIMRPNFPLRLAVVEFALPPYRLVRHLWQDQREIARIQIRRLHENLSAQEVDHEHIGELLAGAAVKRRARSFSTPLTIVN
jgi:hypothetical protein